jgi:hypothetical protein
MKYFIKMFTCSIDAFCQPGLPPRKSAGDRQPTIHLGGSLRVFTAQPPLALAITSLHESQQHLGFHTSRPRPRKHDRPSLIGIGADRARVHYSNVEMTAWTSSVILRPGRGCSRFEAFPHGGSPGMGQSWGGPVRDVFMQALHGAAQSLTGRQLQVRVLAPSRCFADAGDGREFDYGCLKALFTSFKLSACGAAYSS